MSFLSDLFRKRPDPRDEYRIVWQAIVTKAREPYWYLEGGVADTREGRFDMLTAVLALVSISVEKRQELAGGTAYLTELFVEDMEGQLREEGIGDPTVGKRIGKMVGALGGRLKAFSAGLTGPDEMARAVERNITRGENGSVATVAEGLSKFHQALEKLATADLLAGNFSAGAQT